MIGNENKTAKQGVPAVIEKLQNAKFFKIIPLKSLLLTIAVIVFIMVFPNFRAQGELTIGMDDVQIGIHHSEGGFAEIKYVDIESIELVSSIDIGQMISGTGDDKVRSGTYENDIFGTYELYQYVSVESFIVVHKSDSVLVFNLSSLRNTEKFYEELMESYNLYGKK